MTESERNRRQDRARETMADVDHDAPDGESSVRMFARGPRTADEDEE